MKRYNAFTVFVQTALVIAACFTVGTAFADEPKAKKPPAKKSATSSTTSISGVVKFPTEVPDEISTEGISLTDARIILEGKYNHPSYPYPADYKKWKPEQRREWIAEFIKSEAYEGYEKRVEAALAKRPTFETKIAEDGSFVFTDVKPSWYQITAVIPHAEATGKPDYPLARAYAMHQFFVKEDAEKNRVTLRLKVKNVLMPGDQAPPWAAPSFEGEETNLSDFKGKFVLFDFWATWCEPCKAEIPNLKKIHADLGEEVTVVGINIDSEEKTAKDWLKENPSTYKQLYLDEEAYEKISTAYGIESVPAIWLVGPDGKIIARDLYGKEIREAVDAALKK